MFGIYKKKSWCCIIVVDTLEDAQRLVGERTDLEIREILEWGNTNKETK